MAKNIKSEPLTSYACFAIEERTLLFGSLTNANAQGFRR